MDQETLPFQCNLGYQVPRNKAADYVGRERLEWARSEIEAGRYPFRNILVGMALGGRPITDYAPDFWLISDESGGDPVGYVTSPWFAPELGTNIALDDLWGAGFIGDNDAAPTVTMSNNPTVTEGGNSTTVCCMQ